MSLILAEGDIFFKLFSSLLASQGSLELSVSLYLPEVLGFVLKVFKSKVLFLIVLFEPFLLVKKLFGNSRGSYLSER